MGLPQELVPGPPSRPFVENAALDAVPQALHRLDDRGQVGGVVDRDVQRAAVGHSDRAALARGVELGLGDAARGGIGLGALSRTWTGAPIRPERIPSANDLA